jgi:Nif11 domain
MSIAEIQRFAADVSSNAALRAEAEKAYAHASEAMLVDGVIAFATTKGYRFTANELTEHVTAQVEASGKKVTDAELDTVSAGFMGGGGFGAFITLLLLPMYMPSGKTSSGSPSAS